MTSLVPILDTAPMGEIGPYDRDHASLYLRLLDAEAAGAPWREVCEIVLGHGADVELEQARRIYDSHLARAHWLVDGGYAGFLNL